MLEVEESFWKGKASDMLCRTAQTCATTVCIGVNQSSAPPRHLHFGMPFASWKESLKLSRDIPKLDDNVTQRTWDEFAVRHLVRAKEGTLCPYLRDSQSLTGIN